MTDPSSAAPPSPGANVHLRPGTGLDAAGRVAAVQHEFNPDGTYLDTATMGLPPQRAITALTQTFDAWRRGQLDARGFDDVVDRSRALFGELVTTDPSWVAIGGQVSPLVGLVASALPPGAEVLGAAGDFTSMVFPFLAHHRRDITLREVPLDDLVAEVRPSTSWVAVSAVQSADGRLADLDALVEVCKATGTRTLIDGTQAVGWLPLDARRFSVTVTGGYKWLLAPRGTAFMTVQPQLWDELVPTAAGWYAGDDRWGRLYGGPLRLADDARRFDISPAWQAWVGQTASLELLAEVGTGALHEHATGLARRFCDAAGLPFTGSAIVSVGATETVPGRLRDAGIRAASRAGRLRLAFHVSTSMADVDHAAAVLTGHVTS